MIRIAICDDNQIQLDLLNDILLEYVADRRLNAQVCQYNDGNSLLKAARESSFDIYILDMIMPGANGLEVASTLRLMKDDGKIIFLTSSVEYAVKSYDVKAFYYMVKPLDTGKLCSILDDALKTERLKGDFISIRCNNNDMSILVDDVVYVDIIKRCPTYHLADGCAYADRMLRGTFKDSVKAVLEKEGMCLCGISLIINMKYVSAVDSDSILLKEGTLLYPSKSAISDLKKAMGK